MNKDLKVIGNELVPVYVTATGEKVVYGTELHNILDTGTRYNDWIRRRFEDCEAIESEDYEGFTQENVKPNGGRPRREYIIKLDTAKEMAMLERNDKGKQVRRYFIQVEKKYKENMASDILKEMSDNPMKLLEVHYAAIKQNHEEIVAVKERVDKLENNMTITHEQIQVIKNRVNKKIMDLLGGYESNAYKDKHLRGKVYSRFNKDYCDYFRINARANTLTAKYDEALNYIDMWQPDTNLKLQIGGCNAQMNMETA